jgi:hypothetical protein
VHSFCPKAKIGPLSKVESEKKVGLGKIQNIEGTWIVVLKEDLNAGNTPGPLFLRIRTSTLTGKLDKNLVIWLGMCIGDLHNL